MLDPTAQTPREGSAATAFKVPPSALPRSQSFESLLELFSAGGDLAGREPRRHPFHAIARVAPCRGTMPPTDNDFQLVWCHDLSTSGISFYWSTRPDFDQVVVALASPTGTIRVLARVLSYGPLAVQLGQFLVCCQFVRRVTG
ncbi:MAG TPA: hypothetical protein VHY91_19635 [Pirellulales bacterium]|jgi:hypothetical protein|nr:hypothetical protein [Pirellulales bacterium]